MLAVVTLILAFCFNGLSNVAGIWSLFCNKPLAQWIVSKFPDTSRVLAFWHPDSSLIWIVWLVAFAMVLLRFCSLQ